MKAVGQMTKKNVIKKKRIESRDWNVTKKSYCGKKKRKCRLPAFYPFPTMFSKGFCVRLGKTRNYLVRS